MAADSVAPDAAAPVTSVAELRPMSGRRSALAHVGEILRYRELLVLLVRKELAVRYKNSVLGFTWSMLQPLFLLVVYTAVFAILRAGFERFAIWVLCGLLVWTLIASSMIAATSSITSNASLVGKVKFPRAVLPLASVGGALTHFFLQIAAFAVVLVVSRHDVDWTFVWLLPLALLTCLIVCGALALLLAPANVYARDTMHLLELLVLGWFWATPILYEYTLAGTWLDSQGIDGGVQMINPATPIVITFQRALYGASRVGDRHLLPDHGPLWYLGLLAGTAAIWALVGYLALRVFDRADVNLAETL